MNDNRMTIEELNHSELNYQKEVENIARKKSKEKQTERKLIFHFVFLFHTHTDYLANFFFVFGKNFASLLEILNYLE